jgi:hypothetical protein
MLEALQCITDVLDKYLKNLFGLTEDVVVLGKLVNADGTVLQANENRIVVSLINMEVTTAKTPIALGNRQVPIPSASPSVTPGYHLYLLMSANFNEYASALKFLDALVVYFTNNPILDAVIAPELPVGITRLELAFENTSYEQIQSIWATAGAKYQPCVVYKLSIVKK